ncbi:MAG: EamA family transporter RarD [Alphaproteobacteria bacterium]|nr:EamA family transporter RarD [Alphaproteobacteria bacterium]
MSTDSQSSSGVADAERRAGVFAALGAYGMWGLFPVLFRLLDAVAPLMVIVHRIVWSFVLVGAILMQRKRLDEVRAALGSPAALRSIAASAVLLAINWLAFVWAVHNDKVLEVSFGYFINPLVSVAIGMALLGERLSRGHAAALVIALVAVAIMATGISGLPLISLTLAFSFGFYGYFRKTVAVGSAPGLFVETMILLPVALAYLVWSVVTEGPGPLADPYLLALLVFTGPATSLALILFAYASKRLKLATIGMFQYVAPSGHFLLAIFAFGEPLGMVQLISFALIWVSLVVFTADSLMHRRQPPVGGDAGAAIRK